MLDVLPQDPVFGIIFKSHKAALLRTADLRQREEKRGGAAGGEKESQQETKLAFEELIQKNKISGKLYTPVHKEINATHCQSH